MKGFKDYSREYELVFTGDELINKKCNLKQVSVLDNNPPGIDAYINLLKVNLGKMEADYFSSLVKITWLYQRFCYYGKRKLVKMRYGNGIMLEKAFGTFIRNYVGYDNKFFWGKRTPARPIISYFDDFFPNFDSGDPFVENYEYPFKYMSLGCLYLVYRVDERMKLLEHGEKHKMNYASFADYVLNYTKRYNEEHGEKYIFFFAPNGTGSPTIITKKNYEEFKACDFYRRDSEQLSRKSVRTKPNIKSVI